jgi:hypothetical protein
LATIVARPKLPAPQDLVHDPGGVVAVHQGVARIAGDFAGQRIAERTVERLGRLARGVEGDEPAAVVEGARSISIISARAAPALRKRGSTRTLETSA